MWKVAARCVGQGRAFATREAIEYDVAIVGGGPAGKWGLVSRVGLATAVSLKRLAKSTLGQDVSVCLVEKGSAIGSHIISGCILEPKSLQEIFPETNFNIVTVCYFLPHL